MTLLYSLQSSSLKARPSLVGEKAFNLIKLTESGINVPKGFVLTSKVYKQKNEIDLLNLIQDSLKSLNSNYLMIRSSAIGEDGVEHSFAGQLDSFQVKNNTEEVILAIQKCWNSLHNNRVETYSEKSNIELSDMGVIIQEMIEPEYAGVLFTDAPNSPGKKLIEYVEGHCEALVSGKVTPKSFLLPTKEETPKFSKDLDIISDKIYEIYNAHQDIEWAYKDNTLFIVQARPITYISTRISWSSTNVNENYPDKISPLLNSIARRSYYHYFYNLTEEFRLNIPNKGRAYFYNIIGSWGEHMYYNMSAIHKIIAMSPFKGLLSRSFDNFVGYQKEFNSPAKATQIFAKLKFIYSVIEKYLLLEKYVQRVEKEVDEFTDEKIEGNEYILFHEFLELRFNTWRFAACADFFAMLTHGSLGKLLTYVKVSDASGLQNKLIQSIPNLISNRPIYDLWTLKHYVEVNNHVEFFSKYNAEEIWSKIQGQNELKELLKRIDSYLDLWGFRCSGELMFLTPNYIEEPISFIEMLKSYVNSTSPDPADLFKQKQLEQKKYLKQVSSKVRTKYGLLKALILNPVLNFTVFATMKGISARERVRLKQAHMYFKFKQVCMKVESHLIEMKVIDAKDDIFFLEFDEISRILNQEYLDKDYLKNLIMIRRKRFNDQTDFPENFYGDNSKFENTIFTQDEEINLSSNMFAGLPACGGIIEGSVVLLESVSQIDQISKGDILVTKQTDPGWICAFPLISGLIVERGGMLSHGAIVAREFGIPAIVGIKGITEKLKTGDKVRLDGNKGVVECLD